MAAPSMFSLHVANNLTSFSGVGRRMPEAVVVDEVGRRLLEQEEVRGPHDDDGTVAYDDGVVARGTILAFFYFVGLFSSKVPLYLV